ncbi:hypothetical protein D6851_15700 [Altericroceibacterium spongiae]|uniref:Uncharacterized protein n=1 Tax=Altericroceibacterium spongiae TaxID=2320269 RepID=A0A420EAM5_9SPHN|nr:hypothetical protein [Altericroceibacterium spongiae]RKF17703.1 hypothetical protein D6851_15700 [Altericroceibacterium spongiae]
MDIDDTALASINEGRSRNFLSPTGPFKVDDGDGVKDNIARREAEDGERYALNVIFPAYADRTGAHHPRQTETVEVTMPGGDYGAGEMAGRTFGYSSRGLLGAAESAPKIMAQSVLPGAAVEAKESGNPIARIQEQVAASVAAEGETRRAESFPGGVE